MPTCRLAVHLLRVAIYHGGKTMTEITLSIPNISCHHCVMTIQRETGFVDGAEFVSGEVEAKTATFQIASDETLTSLKETLSEAGYPAE